MDVIKLYQSLCKSCYCHPCWHTTDGVCRYDTRNIDGNGRTFKGCNGGCEGYVPTDNLEYLEYEDAKRNQ